MSDTELGGDNENKRAVLPLPDAPATVVFGSEPTKDGDSRPAADLQVEERELLDLRNEPRWDPQSPRSSADPRIVRELVSALDQRAVVVATSLDEDPLRAAIGAVVTQLHAVVLEMSHERVAAPRHSKRAEALLLEDLANARLDGQPALVVVWARTDRTLAFVESLFSSREALAAAETSLCRQRIRVLALTREKDLRLGTESRKRREAMRDTVRALEVLEVVQRDDAARLKDAQILAELFETLFDKGGLRAFVASLPDVHGKDLPDAKTNAEASHSYAELVVRCGAVNDDMERLLCEARPGKRADIAAAWSKLARSRDQNERRRKELVAKLEQLKAASSEDDAPFPVVHVDAIDAYMRAHVPDIGLRDRFERQRIEGRWGATADEVVKALARCVAKNSLPNEIRLRGERSANWPTAERLLKMDKVAQAALFVACYLQDLHPDEFDSVLTELLRCEDAVAPPPQREDREAGDGDASAGASREMRAAPLGLNAIWRSGMDDILVSCDLGVEEVEDVGPRVVWRCPAHAPDWKALLQRNRYYFVTRQLEHLKSSGLLVRLPEVGGRELFEKLLEVLIAQAQLSPERHAAPWLRWFKDAILQLQDAATNPTSAPQTNLQLLEALKEVATILGWRELFISRLSTVIRRMMKESSLRPIVEAFLSELVDSESGTHSWLREILASLSDVIEEMRYLGQIYALDRNEAVRPEVARIVRNRCFEWHGVHRATWKAIDEWLPAEIGEKRVTSEQHLALEAAAQAVILSTHTFGWMVTRQAPVFQWLLTEDISDPPAILRWLVHPAVWRWMVGGRRGGVEYMWLRVLFPPKLDGEGVDVRDDVIALYRRAMAQRFTTGSPRDVARIPVEALRPIAIASALTLITWRLASTDEETTSAPPLRSIAVRLVDGVARSATRSLLLDVIGALAVFESVLQHVLTKTSPRSGAESEQDRQFDLHYGPMAEATRTLCSLLGTAVGERSNV